MAKGFDIKGLKKVLKDLENLGDDGYRAIVQLTEGNAREIESDAKQLAPLNKKIGLGGTLRNNIKSTAVSEIKSKQTFWKVFANYFGTAPYSAYMEFGTGGLVEVPEELQDVAIKFKGKGIRQINIRPQPYLYPAFVKGRKRYFEDLKDAFNSLAKKV